jgi:hypothetical protein
LLLFRTFSAINVGKDGFNATKSEFWSHDNDEDDAHSDDDISASEGITHLYSLPRRLVSANRVQVPLNFV